MADQDLMHTAEIMKAALPYIDAHNKVMVEFLVKLFELIGYFKTFRNSLSLAACGYGDGKTDMEGMLNNIRPVCNKKERDLIDKILNIFNMKRAMDMYNKMMDAMNAMQQDSEDFSFDSPASDTSEEDTSADFSYNNPDMDAVRTDRNDSDDTADAPVPPEGSSASTPVINDRMLQMLKAIVPPEQKVTFDNLSMLLNAMSYDNNSKADESKEQESNGQFMDQ